MDINDILTTEREGKLSGYSIATLHEMRKICVTHIQKNDWFAFGAIKSVDDEISRKEANEVELKASLRHREMIAEQKRLKTAVDLLARPHWVIWATFVASAIAAIAAVILLFR